MGHVSRPAAASSFDVVCEIGRTLPGVEATTRYDGSPVLRVRGVFLAGTATHPSAEPGTLVVRADPEEREWFLADARGTYYLTDYYGRYPVVLVRLSQVDRGAVHELLSMSWRLAVAKAPPRRAARRARPRR